MSRNLAQQIGEAFGFHVLNYFIISPKSLKDHSLSITFIVSQGPYVVLNFATNPDLPVIKIGASIQLDCCSAYSGGGREVILAWQLFLEYMNGIQGGLLVGGQRFALELTLIGDFSRA